MNTNTSDTRPVVTRFAPSPTGNLHIGSARTALFNYLFTKKNKGKMVLRLEDTDRDRSRDEYEVNILEGLSWLGLDHDVYYKQSDRADMYSRYIQNMIETGVAYLSKEESGQRSEVIRFKNPNKRIIFDDIVRGNIEFDTTELGDFVIAKSLTEPLYHLAVVIDDHESQITHVIRGEDHISNTPRQILIQEGIGASRPFYAHIPMILAPDRTKLSKRHGAVALTEYKEQGYLSEAVLNYLAFLGWNPGGEREIYSLKDIIDMFSLYKIQRSAAIFNKDKLDWYNREYLKEVSDETFYEGLREVGLPQDMAKKLIPFVRERVSRLRDISELFASGGEFDFFLAPPDIGTENLIWKGKGAKESVKEGLEEVKEHLSRLRKSIEMEKKNLTAERVREFVWEYATEKGRGNVLWPFRYALSGKERSPDPFTLAYILGKKESIDRIDKAITAINEHET
jgi:glutamyl-tRNA synthetase